MKNISDIEKCAKLMGYEPMGTNIYGVFEVDKQPENKQPHTASTFNPYTNKADLMGVECALLVDIEWHENYVLAWVDEWTWEEQQYADHPDKFTARAHAVMAVVEQIYDAKYGKDGE